MVDLWVCSTSLGLFHIFGPVPQIVVVPQCVVVPQIVVVPHLGRHQFKQPEDVEQPQDVEQAQRGGTGPKRWNRGKISNTFQCFRKNGCRPRCGTAQRCRTGPKRWNRPKEVEQRKDQQYFSVLLKKIGCRPRCGTSL